MGLRPTERDVYLSTTVDQRGLTDDAAGLTQNVFGRCEIHTRQIRDACLG
jgi:hypothetical protein